MKRFLLRRAAWFVLTLWLVMTSAFFLMRAVPGGPFDDERRVSAAIEANLEARYHLDWPAWKQYLQYVGPLNLDQQGWAGDGSRPFGGLLAGDLGPSFRYADFTVNEILAQSLPTSFLLGSLALAWAILIGGLSGVAAALWRDGRIDVGLRLLATLGVALPNFVLAALLIMLFSSTLAWLPSAGSSSLRHFVLPSLALGLPIAAYVTRLVRTGILDALAQDWVQTARAKGFSRRRVVTRFALRLGLLPALSYLAPAAAGVLTGSLVIERIFALPGAGSHFVNSALNRDYTLALGVTLVYTVLVYLLNTLVDLVHAWIDPRLAIEEL